MEYLYTHPDSNVDFDSALIRPDGTPDLDRRKDTKKVVPWRTEPLLLLVVHSTEEFVLCLDEEPKTGLKGFRII